MHDPMTVAFTIRWPWGREVMGHRYRAPIVTIWHVDPEHGGDDDSCDWFGNRVGMFPAAKDDLAALSDEARRAVQVTLYILGDRRPWYRRPRWHVHHWRFQVHPWGTFRRWLLSRCAGCGRRFAWGYCPITYQWTAPCTPWFGSEIGSYHRECLPRSEPPA